MPALWAAGHDEAVDVFACEPHLDPGTGHGGLGHGLGDHVVERSIQVSQWYVDQHRGHRVKGSRSDGWANRGRAGRPGGLASQTG